MGTVYEFKGNQYTTYTGDYDTATITFPANALTTNISSIAEYLLGTIAYYLPDYTNWILYIGIILDEDTGTYYLTIDEINPTANAGLPLVFALLPELLTFIVALLATYLLATPVVKSLTEMVHGYNGGGGGGGGGGSPWNSIVLGVALIALVILAKEFSPEIKQYATKRNKNAEIAV